MKCEILHNGRVVAGKMDYTVDHAAKVLSKYGIPSTYAPQRLTSRVDIATLSIYPVREVKPTTDRFTSLSVPTREVQEDAIVYTYGTRARGVEEVRSQLLSDLAQVHEDYEKGRVELRGAWVNFDLEARINAAGVVKGFEEGIITESAWRGKQIDSEGNYFGVAKIPLVSLDEAKEVEQTIMGAVNKGFTAKEQLEATLENANQATLADFNVKSAFYAAL